VIYDWRGEYFNNPKLSGAPALVRNDVAINFDWGNGSPGPGLPDSSMMLRQSRRQAISKFRSSRCESGAGELVVTGSKPKSNLGEQGSVTVAQPRG
jgi:hypothetical protein